MITHLENYPRFCKVGPKIEHCTTHVAKTAWYANPFIHYFAMFIFNGSGRITVDGRDYSFGSPFVIFAQPGHQYSYGPDEHWDEFGFCFEETDENSPIFQCFPVAPWPIRSPNLVREQLLLAKRLLSRPAVKGVADQVDVLTHLILLTSYHGSGEDDQPDPERQLHDAEAWLRLNFHENIKLAELAQKFGFSEPTFRRLWRKHFNKPPWQHVLDLRLREAIRLLRFSPELRINEIADRCGLPNQRHFASWIKEQTGYTPTEYRERSSRVVDESAINVC